MKLPSSRELMTEVVYNLIFIIIDLLMKYTYFIPYIEELGAEELVYWFQKTIINQHGLSDKVISDRDIRLTSNF